MATTPSIAMIPSGYQAGKIYSVLPTNGDADLNFSRSVVANRINSDGLIEEMAIDVPRLDYSNGTCPSLLLEPQSTNLITYPLSFGNAYWTKSGANIEGDASTAGSEEVVNGDFATDSDWSKSSNWSIINGEAVADGSSSAQIFQTTLSLSENENYKINFNILSASQGEIKVYINDGIFRQIYNSSELGSHQALFQSESTTTSGVIYFYAGNNFIGSIDNVSVKEVQGFSAPSVDNPTSAFKLVEDTSTGSHWVFSEIITTPIGNNYNASFYVKKGERNWVFIQTEGSDRVWFDLENGVIGTQIGSVGKIESLGSGWFRISTTYLEGVANSRAILSLSDADGSNSYTGDGTSGVYIFGAQLEALPYATSLMLPATEGSTVTRVAETASETGLSSEIGQTEGTIIVSFNISGDISGNRSVITLSSGGSVDFVASFINNDLFYARIRANNGYWVDVTKSGLAEGFHKVAIAYASNDLTFYLDGVLVGQNTSASVSFASELSKIILGGSTTASNQLGSGLSQFLLYKTRLTNSELSTLTTI